MRIILFLLLGWYTIGNIQAQIKEPVKFKNELKMTSETEAEIVFTASIEKGWHVYSTGLGDDGPISATFNISIYSGEGFLLEVSAFDGGGITLMNKKMQNITQIRFIAKKIQTSFIRCRCFSLVSLRYLSAIDKYCPSLINNL